MTITEMQNPFRDASDLPTDTASGMQDQSRCPDLHLPEKTSLDPTLQGPLDAEVQRPWSNLMYRVLSRIK